MNNKKIVITGASGFLGSHLVERLKEAEPYKVYALSSKPGQLKERIGGENIEYVHKDTMDAEMFKDSIIVNCAFPRNSTGTGTADGLKYIQRVFETAVESEAFAIINISSQSVYSQQRTEAATEETPVCLESPYAVGKYAVELMLESICKGRGTAYTNLRLASLIGPGFDQRIVNRFVKQALETGELTVKRNRQRFGFFDVEDAINGVISILGSDEKKWKSIYNLGGINAYTLVEIAETVRNVLSETNGVQISVEIVDGEEVLSSDLNCALFYREFDFTPQFSLLDSVNKISNRLIHIRQ